MCGFFADCRLFDQVVLNQFKSSDPAPAVKKLPHNDALMAQVCMLFLLPFSYSLYLNLMRNSSLFS